MVKVLITGPESSGKSYLTEKLANHFGGLFVEEYARSYLHKRNGYDVTDLLEIARGQLLSEKRMVQSNASILFCDTGVEVIKIWSQVKFGYVDPLVEQMCDYSRYDVILVCKPNIPWEEDTLRESRNFRNDLFGMYMEELKGQVEKSFVIDEKMPNRFQQALDIIHKELD